MIVDYCMACDREIRVEDEGEFNRIDHGLVGPFCGGCWFFVEEIEALKDRVKALEGPAPMHPSPYDASRRQAGRQQL